MVDFLLKNEIHDNIILLFITLTRHKTEIFYPIKKTIEWYKMLKKICHQDQILAIIVYSSHETDGIQFYTSNSEFQQLASMNRPEGYLIQPHTHNKIVRTVDKTNEFLYIKKGKLRIDFYTDERIYLESSILETGDVILILNGAHGLKMLEQTEIIEIKQGPYLGENDKTRFESIDDSKIIIKE